MKKHRNHKKPVIGVTGPNKGGWIAWLFTHFAIWRVGGKATHIMPARPIPLEKLDGLIIGGGADVDPSLYGESSREVLNELQTQKQTFRQKISAIFLFFLLYLLRKLFSIKIGVKQDKARDELEFDLIDKAVKQQLPILGICRGAQLLNVYFQGSLYQDISHFYVDTPKVHTIFPKKIIYVEKDSHLAKILQNYTIWVNGLHNQAIKILGNNLRVVAQEDNGVIQAIEHQYLPFVIGVQWHPEYLPLMVQQQQIFQTLVQRAKIWADEHRIN